MSDYKHVWCNRCNAVVSQYALGLCGCTPDTKPATKKGQPDDHPFRLTRNDPDPGDTDDLWDAVMGRN